MCVRERERERESVCVCVCGGVWGGGGGSQPLCIMKVRDIFYPVVLSLASIVLQARSRIEH